MLFAVAMGLVVEEVVVVAVTVVLAFVVPVVLTVVSVRVLIDELGVAFWLLGCAF